MNYKRTILNNGLRLIIVPMDHVQSATVIIFVGAGSRYERKNINGLSHFLEHMAFKGTTRRPTAFAISSEIEGVGGEFNAFTSKDQTAFYIKAASKHIPLMIDVLSDMLLNSKFDPAEIEREKGVITEEINLYEDTPSRKIGEIYEELLYGDTPLGWDIAGRKEVIKSIKRQDFLDYTKGLYGPKNAVVVIAGGIGETLSNVIANGAKQSHSGDNEIAAITSRPRNDVISLVEKALGGWQNKATWHYEKMSDNQNQPACKVVYKKTEQAHLALGVRGYNFSHPDRYVLGVLATILGGGMSSRLFIQVRGRRGLAYYVHSGTEHYSDVGHFVTLAGVDLNKIDEAIKVIREEYWKISRSLRQGNTSEVARPARRSLGAGGRDSSDGGGIGEGELTKAKEFLKGRLILELEDSRAIAGMYGSSEILENKIKTPEEILAKIDKVTLSDIERVACDIFKPAKLNLAVIGPFEDRQRFEKLLE